MLIWFVMQVPEPPPPTPLSNAWPVLGRPPSEHEGKIFTLLKGLGHYMNTFFEGLQNCISTLCPSVAGFKFLGFLVKEKNK